MIADTTRSGAPSSIAVDRLRAVGLSGRRRTRLDRPRGRGGSARWRHLRFFMGSDQSGRPDATGYRGFYFHFLDMRDRHARLAVRAVADRHRVPDRRRADRRRIFHAETPAENELRRLADALYRRVDWRWAQRDGAAVMHGWKPECGFLHYGWEGYSEAILLYVLGLGSPTHPLTEQSFRAWTVTYQWENLYGYDFLYAGPLFIHQFSHAWIDFRGIRGRLHAREGLRLFREQPPRDLRSARVRDPQPAWLHRLCRRLLGAFGGRRPERRAAPGRRTPPGVLRLRRARRSLRARRRHDCRRVDALVDWCSHRKSRCRRCAAWCARAGDDGELVRASGFNPTVSEAGPNGWISEGSFGLDQGMIVLMIENYRSGLLWRLSRGNPLRPDRPAPRRVSRRLAVAARARRRSMLQAHATHRAARQGPSRPRALRQRPPAGMAQPATPRPVPPARHRRRARRAGRGARRRRARREGRAGRTPPARRRLPELRLRAVEDAHPHVAPVRRDAQRRKLRRHGRRTTSRSIFRWRWSACGASARASAGSIRPRASRRRHRRVFRRRRASPAAMRSTSTEPALRFKKAVIATGLALDAAVDSGPGRSRLPDQRDRLRPDRAAAAACS